MNPKPIEEARNSLIAVALPALLRARRRAEEIAIRTGTALVFSKNGRTVLVYPKAPVERSELEPRQVQ
jgi:hypothetical protein